MPWRVVKRNDKFCVVKISSGETVACHDSKESADSQRKALYASESYGLTLAVDTNEEITQILMAAQTGEELWADTKTFEKETDVNRPGGSHNLKNYWVRGPGAAKIRWGTDGSFDRCVRQVGKYVRDPQGLCAEYHKAATGEWPAEKGVESGVSGLEELNVTDGHGHVHGRDGKFTDKVGGKLDVGATDVATARKFAEKRNPGKKIHVMRVKDKDIIRDEDETVNEALEDFEPFLEVTKREDGYELRSSREHLEAVQKAHRLKNDISADNDADQVSGDGEFASKTAEPVDGKKAETYAAGDTDEPWEGVLTVEGIESGDGRLFALGGLDWEAGPMPLMYQPANVGGHTGSFMVGNITDAVRRGSRIRGKGVVFESALAGPHGTDIRHMMETGGVSVDVDKVKDANVEMVYAEAGEGGDGVAQIMAKPELTIFHKGRIRGATLVAYPAFVEAKLSFIGDMVTASCACEDTTFELDDPLTASAHTITIPDLPPADWFKEPTDVELSGALTITDEGRVYGILAPANVSHRVRGRQVPRGNVDYTRFHKGETIVAGGGRVVTGVITADCGHAPIENYGTLQNRMDHYDNSCSVLANVRVGESRKGYVWFAGALNPGAKPHQVSQALGCALSGDWQPHLDRPGLQDFIAAHLVPVPGFPMARTQASVVYQDGLITASSVPVEFGKAKKRKIHAYEIEQEAFAAITFAKQCIAEAAGLDIASQKRAIALSLES